jgi:actin-related protein 3
MIEAIIDYKMELPAVVFDNGTGYTKMGLSCNPLPTYDIPTSIASKATMGVQVSRMQCDDLDFFIGEEAFLHQKTHQLFHPIKEGQINEWDEMEKFWQRCIFEKLHVEPQAHNFLLTEPPMNTPENREQIAEIFFETFDVKGLYLGVQAVFALQGYNYLTERSGQSGVVVDAGDGVTHIIPVAHGFVINSCVKQIPMAGRDITKYIMKSLKDRGERIPTEDLMDIAKQIKEKYCYVCGNPDKEERKFRDPNSDSFRIFETVGKYTGTPLSIKVGNERYRGPEVFFNPVRLT